MTRLVVVSRNAALPFALNSAGHEVLVVDDDGDVRWGEYVTYAEVVLLDLGEPAAADLLVDGIARSTIDPVRVLLIASSTPNWKARLDAPTRPGTALLPLPLSMPRLSAALEVLLSGPPLAHTPGAAPPPVPAAAPAAAVEEPAPAPAAAAPAQDPQPATPLRQPEPPAVLAPEPPPVPEPVAVVAPEPEPEPAVEVEPDPAVAVEPEPAIVAPPAASLDVLPADETEPVQAPEPAEEQPWYRISALSRPQGSTSWQVPTTPPSVDLSPTEPAPASDPAVEHEPVAVATEIVADVEPEPDVDTAAAGEVLTDRHDPPVPHVISVIRTLTHSVGELATVEDTAEIVASESRKLLRADAVAVLVRDGLVWRVAAGEELRPLEHRVQLAPDHWLVQEVSKTWHGVLLSGGDGQWAELYGAPLSYRTHLLAAPLPPVGAILMMARDEEPFTEAELEGLLPFAEEAGHLLSDASDVRRLARLLRPFCDDVD